MGSSRPAAQPEDWRNDIAELVRHGGIGCLHSAVLGARHEPVRDDIALLELWRLPAAVPAIAITPETVGHRAPAIEG